jgi:hypothetical protein
MAGTGRKTTGGVADSTSSARPAGWSMTSLAGSNLSGTLQNGAENRPHVAQHPAAASTKDALIALARLLGQAAARELMEQTVALPGAVDQASTPDQGEASR